MISNDIITSLSLTQVCKVSNGDVTELLQVGLPLRARMQLTANSSNVLLHRGQEDDNMSGVIAMLQ